MKLSELLHILVDVMAEKGDVPLHGGVTKPLLVSLDRDEQSTVQPVPGERPHYNPYLRDAGGLPNGATLRWMEEVQAFARKVHEGQTHDDDPYWVHLQDTVDVLARFDVDDLEVIAAGWLHDSLSYSNTTLRELTELFGEGVSRMVWAVTAPVYFGPTKRATMMATKIPAIRGAMTVKLAALIAAMERSQKNDDTDAMERSQKEYFALIKETRESPVEGVELAMKKHIEEMVKTKDGAS